MRPTTRYLTRRLLSWSGIHNEAVADWIAAKALVFNKDGHATNDFVRWCRSDASRISGRDREFYELLFWSAWAVTDADRRYTDRAFVGSADVFPFLWINAHACSVDGHQKLDGFCAKRDDRIWDRLTEPFGWRCSCVVLPLMASEVGAIEEVSKDAIGRLGEAPVARVERWYEKPPDHLGALTSNASSAL